MSNISSIPASAPMKAPEANESMAPKTPEVKNGGDASAPQPTVLAPLPPGQGTRINQIA